MADYDSLIEMLRTELRQGFSELRQGFGELRQGFGELRQGFHELSLRIDRNTAVLESHTSILEEHSRQITRLADDVGDVKNVLSLTLVRLEDFQIEVSRRFDGVGSYLRSINGTLRKHGQHLESLDVRVSRLEQDRETEGG